MNRAHLYFIIIFSLLVTGCQTAGHRYVKINPPDFGAQFVPGQLHSLFLDTGFQRTEFKTRVRDLNAGPTDALNMKRGEVIDTSDKLLMLYQHINYPVLLVSVSVVKDTGKVNLDFYETDRKELSPEAIAIYNQFIKKVKSGLYDENDITEK